MGNKCLLYLLDTIHTEGPWIELKGELLFNMITSLPEAADSVIMAVKIVRAAVRGIVIVSKELLYTVVAWNECYTRTVPSQPYLCGNDRILCMLHIAHNGTRIMCVLQLKKTINVLLKWAFLPPCILLGTLFWFLLHTL